MTPRQIGLVARFHSSQPGCAPFRLEDFGSKVWRGHFELDLETLLRKPSKRDPAPGEVGAIIRFLEEGGLVSWTVDNPGPHSGYPKEAVA